MYFVKAYPVNDTNIQLISIYDGHKTIVVNEKITIATCAVYAQYIQNKTI